MPDVLRSLDEITTGFKLFEENQVLTHDQLNTLGGYLDDQERLTRIGAIGAGVCCGLRPSLVDFTVRVTKGVGLTTDGDLIRLGADVVYDRYQPYDDAAPVYAPFFNGTTRMPLFELVRADDKKTVGAIPLANFSGRTGVALETMVAVLYMESYVRDPDLCSGTDCDNLGKDALNTARVLLVDQASARVLRPTFDTPDAAGRDLDVVAARRPIMKPDTDTPGGIRKLYLDECQKTLDRLKPSLAKIYPRCSGFLQGLFGQDPAPAWARVLDGFQSQAAIASLGVQYYYSYLLDLVETYTAFKTLLSGDTVICAPDFGGFPKHLLLGRLSPDRDTSQWRTGFYPSPAVADGLVERQGHARFLVRKLDAMIFTFQLPQQPSAVLVTPSRLESAPLEERAIPYYYIVNDIKPIHRAWNYRLERQGLSACNYSYNASQYAPLGGAAEPMNTPVTPNTLFRVEGHVGRSVQDALDLINQKIRDNNLPFTVRAVMLDPDVRKLPWKLPFVVTDLHRLHYIIRNDLATQLADTKDFSDTFKGAVDAAIQQKTVADDPVGNDGITLHQFSDEKSAALKTQADVAIGKLAVPFEAHRAAPTWQQDVNNTLTLAKQYKAGLGKVVKTDFSSAYDNLIGSTHIQWLPWLQDIIDKRDEQNQKKVLFGTFLTEHWGLEHRGGVPAGGTLVLAHDTAGTVVADFALPYFAPAPVEDRDEGDEPPLVKPPVVRPPIFVVPPPPLKILPSNEKLIADKLADFRVSIQPDLNKAIDVQSKYFDGLKDSLSIIGTAFSSTTKVPPAAGGGISTTKVLDPALDSHLQDTRAKMQAVDFIKNQLLDPSLSDPANADRQTALQTQLAAAENDVAASVNETTKYVASNAVDVSPGSDGATAMATVSEALNRVNSKDALTTVTKGLQTASAAPTASAGLPNVIASVLRVKGLK